MTMRRTKEMRFRSRKNTRPTIRIRIEDLFSEGKVPDILIKYDENIDNIINIEKEAIILLNKYRKGGKLNIVSNLYDPYEILVRHRVIIDFLLLFNIPYKSIISLSWMKERFELEYSIYNNKTTSIMSYPMELMQEKISDVIFREDSVIRNNNIEYLKLPEPIGSIVVGYPVSCILCSSFIKADPLDTVTIIFRDINKRQRSKIVYIVKGSRKYIYYYMPKITSRSIGNYLLNPNIPHIMKCVYYNNILYYTNTWFFCIVKRLNVVDRFMIEKEGNNIYKILINSIMNKSSYVIYDNI